MYVISIDAPSVPTGAPWAANTVAFLPADRCIFRTEYNDTTGQYEVHGLVYQGGSTLILAPAGSTIALGYICKSGRFVAVTDYRTST